MRRNVLGRELHEVGAAHPNDLSVSDSTSYDKCIRIINIYVGALVLVPALFIILNIAK